jgi:hypothetical protein
MWKTAYPPWPGMQPAIGQACRGWAGSEAICGRIGVSEYHLPSWAEGCRFYTRNLHLYDPDQVANTQRQAQVERDLSVAGVGTVEAARLAALGAERHTRGQVLINTLLEIQRLHGAGVSSQERHNGMGDILRRMTQQDSGILWDQRILIDNNHPLLTPPEAAALPSGHPLLLLNSGGHLYGIPTQGRDSIAAWTHPSYPEAMWCHGLSFGGADLPNGPRMSILSGDSVTVLRTQLYRRIVEGDARVGDVMVWRPLQQNPHSAVLTHVVLEADGLSMSRVLTRLQTKNGVLLPEMNMSLDELMHGHPQLLPAGYGPNAHPYRRRGT